METLLDHLSITRISGDIKLTILSNSRITYAWIISKNGSMCLILAGVPQATTCFLSVSKTQVLRQGSECSQSAGKVKAIRWVGDEGSARTQEGCSIKPVAATGQLPGVTLEASE